MSATEAVAVVGNPRPGSRTATVATAVLDAARGRSVEIFMPELQEEDEDGATLSAPAWMHDLLASRP